MKTRLLLAGLVGLIIGLLGSWLFIGRRCADTFAQQYTVSVMDQANVALHIRAGKEAELLDGIERSLPTYALAVDEHFRAYPGATDALWMIKAYYQRNEISMPPEIAGILAALPPKPPTSCQLRLRALDVTSDTGPSD